MMQGSKKSLENLANSGPEGKKAAEHLLSSIDLIDDASADVDDLLNKFGIKK